jgi:hypothetical protein
MSVSALNFKKGEPKPGCRQAQKVVKNKSYNKVKTGKKKTNSKRKYKQNK